MMHAFCVPAPTESRTDVMVAPPDDQDEPLYSSVAVVFRIYLTSWNANDAFCVPAFAEPKHTSCNYLKHHPLPKLYHYNSSVHDTLEFTSPPKAIPAFCVPAPPNICLP